MTFEFLLRFSAFYFLFSATPTGFSTFCLPADKTTAKSVTKYSPTDLEEGGGGGGGGLHNTHISSISSSAHDLTSTIHDPGFFHSRLISSSQVHAPSKSPDELRTTPTFQSKSRHSSVTPEDLSKRWFIGLKRARDTIRNTTQRILRSALLPLARRHRVDRM